MKRLFAFLVILTISVTAVYSNGLGFMGSYWTAHDIDDAGMGGGAKFKIQTVPNMFLEFRAGHLHNFFESPLLENLELIPLEVDMVIEFPIIPAALSILVGGGAGYYLLPEYEISTTDAVKLDPEDVFGFYAVGIAELSLNKQVALFGEAKYNWVEEFEVTETINLTGISINAGLLLRW